MAKKTCCVYLKDNYLIIVSQEKTVDGVFLEKEPVFIFKIDESTEKIGELINKSLENYQENVLHPQNFNGRKHVGLKYAKVKTYREFISQVKLCFVCKDNEYKIIPTSKGDTKGFYELEPIIIQSNASNKILGKAVLGCFNKCR